MPRADGCGPTPHQQVLLEGALVTPCGNRLDVVTSMAVYSTVTSYVRGAVDSEIGPNRPRRRPG
ncbi:hypothetical protein ACWD0G_29280 [Streptomyces goshikiensis]